MLLFQPVVAEDFQVVDVNVIVVVERYEGIFSEPGIGEYGEIEKIDEVVKIVVREIYAAGTRRPPGPPGPAGGRVLSS